MSFFNQKGDDSNLQYDDAAFLYFIASSISIAFLINFGLIIRDLLSLGIKDSSKLAKNPLFKQKLKNLRSEKIRSFKNRFLIKLVILAGLSLLFFIVYQQSQKASNKLKGFDPFEILGVPKDASLRDIKKAYRKLALEYHPDKNTGNPEAQNKFILISKSFQCFTNEEKKANCFKFGNPDGEGVFRVGIGLPDFFIKVQYKFYVLPIVLAIFLVLIPGLMIRFFNKTRLIDQRGVSINSYPTFFRSIANPQEKIDQFTFLYIMASYTELYEDAGCGPITEENKVELFKLIKSTPNAEKEVLHELNDNQLQIVWQLFRYCANLADFSFPSLREKIEIYLSKTIDMALMFATKFQTEVYLCGNPEWKIRYLGPTFIECFLNFERSYYNRALLVCCSDNTWLYHLDIPEQDRKYLRECIVSGKAPHNLYEILKVPGKMKAFLDVLPAEKRAKVEIQLKTFPVYDLSLKLKVDKKEVDTLTNTSYAELYFKVKRTNQTDGYSMIKNYPYPKKDSIYVMGIEEGNVLFLYKTKFDIKKDEFIQKFAYKTGKLGGHNITVFVIHQSLFKNDINCSITFKVNEVSEEEINRPVQYHPEDVNMELMDKSFFETLIQLEIDPEENQLSDGEDEPKDKDQGQQDSGQSDDSEVGIQENTGDI